MQEGLFDLLVTANLQKRGVHNHTSRTAVEAF